MYERLAPYPEWVIPIHVFPTPSVSFHLGPGPHPPRVGEAATQTGRPRRRALARSLLLAVTDTARRFGLLGVERDAAALLEG